MRILTQFLSVHVGSTGSAAGPFARGLPVYLKVGEEEERRRKKDIYKSILVMGSRGGLPVYLKVGKEEEGYI